MRPPNIQNAGAVLGAARAQLYQTASRIVFPKAKRGRPPLGIRPYVRKDRGGEAGRSYFYDADGKLRSLMLPGDAHEQREFAVHLAKEKEVARQLGFVDPTMITIGEIVDWEKSQLDPGPQGTVKAISDHRQRAMKLDRMAAFFGRDRPVGEINKALCKTYVAYMRTKPIRPDDPTSKTYSRGTIRVDLSWLRAAIVRYMDDHSVSITAKVLVPPRSKPRKNWLNRADIAILTMSALKGWTWNPEGHRFVDVKRTDPVTGEITYVRERREGCWLDEDIVDPETGETMRRRVVAKSFRRWDARARALILARTILIAFYTGTRLDRLRYLCWDVGHPYFGWIDVNRGVIVRAGVENGERDDDEHEHKPAGTSVLPRPLLFLAKGWRAADMARGYRFILHKPDGALYKAAGMLTRRLQTVGRRCGYDDIIMHEMRHSTVTVCLLHGISISDTAAYVDVTEDMVKRVYSHLDEAGTRAGALAMGRKGDGTLSPSRNRANEIPFEMMKGHIAMTVKHRN